MYLTIIESCYSGLELLTDTKTARKSRRFDVDFSRIRAGESKPRTKRAIFINSQVLELSVPYVSHKVSHDRSTHRKRCRIIRSDRRTETNIFWCAGLNMFDLINKLFFSLCGGRGHQKSKLIGVATDRAGNMTGHLTDAVTRIVWEYSEEVYNIWCGGHHWYLAMREVFSEHVKELFQDQLHGLIYYIRR